MNKNRYIYPNQKRLSIRLSKKLYNKLSRKAKHSHTKLSVYVRYILREMPVDPNTVKATRKHERQNRSRIINSNIKLDRKLEHLKNYPWRACENLNQLALRVNRGQSYTGNALKIINSAKLECQKLYNYLEAEKR